MNNRLLKALAIGLKYDVSYAEDKLHIEDKSEEYGYGAVVDGDTKKIYLTGCYNSGIDWIELDLEKIKELSEFVETLTEVEAEDTDTQITVAKVKLLRQHTGAGMMECKSELRKANGDIIKAYNEIIYKGLA